MLGLSIISTQELKRLRDIDELFSLKIFELNEEHFRLKSKIDILESEVKKITPKRASNGKFVKK
jgi:hypothetical protein